MSPARERSAAGAFAGEIGLIGPFDLGQLLQLNGATGRLTITSDGRTGYLYFDRGQLINAVDDRHQEGEAAAYRLFARTRGHFEFTAEVPATARLIETSTEGVMLEAARRVDEEAGEAGAGQAERLRERQGAMEALRDVFRDVAHEARAGTPGRATPLDAMLDALESADDRLLLATGMPPRLRRDGTWRALNDAPLTVEARRELKGALLDGAEVADGSATDGGVRFRAALRGGALHVAVTALGEGDAEQLWIRRMRLPAPALEAWQGTPDAAAPYLSAPSAVLLAAAGRPGPANDLMFAVADSRLRQTGGTALAAGDDPVWVSSAAGGVLLWAAAARAVALARVTSPTMTVLPADHDLSAEALESWLRAPVVIAAAVAGSADEALAQWVAALPPGPAAMLRARLEVTPTAVLFARDAASGGAPALEVRTGAAAWGAARGAAARRAA